MSRARTFELLIPTPPPPGTRVWYNRRASPQIFGRYLWLPALSISVMHRPRALAAAGTIPPPPSILLLGGCLTRLVRENGGQTCPRGRGNGVRSSGYGLMVVKTTDSAADAEQIALSGASRRPPNAKICPAYCRKRAKPPPPCPETARSAL